MSEDSREIRRQIIRRRKSLDPGFIGSASAAIASEFCRHEAFWRAESIAAYMAVNGEVDTGRIMQAAWLRKKRIFLPVMAGKRLKFSELKKGAKMLANPVGILEPVYKKQDLKPPGSLEIVLVPLVAFDRNLNRVGMGGGYYDRAFAFSKLRKKWRKPLLVGVAYSFQQVDKINPEAWDVPLHAVITEEQVFFTPSYRTEDQ